MTLHTVKMSYYSRETPSHTQHYNRRQIRKSRGHLLLTSFYLEEKFYILKIKLDAHIKIVYFGPRLLFFFFKHKALKLYINDQGAHAYL